MEFMQKLALFLLLLLSCSCATLPTGPSVNVLPAPGKYFDTFRTEDATCRHWAEQHRGVSPQKTYERACVIESGIKRPGPPRSLRSDLRAWRTAEQ